MISKVKKRKTEKMAGRTKRRTIENDKWGRKDYIGKINKRYN